MIFQNMINMQMMMFLLVIIGFIIRKKEVVSEVGRTNMVDLCLYVTLPFNIFHAFMVTWEKSMLYSFLTILALSAGYNIISIIISKFCFQKSPEERRNPLRYATIVSNGGFLGNPVIEGIYGVQGLFYASVFMLPVRIVMWTVGTSCFLKEGKTGIFRKVMTHPCIIAIYAGILFMWSGIHAPAFLEKTITGISSCNTPISMMLVGMMLAEMNPRGLIDKTMVWFTTLRLVVIPLIILGITLLLPIDPLLRGIAVIIAGMPAPITTALLASKYNASEAYATAMIFVSTVCSLVTLPLLTLLL